MKLTSIFFILVFSFSVLAQTEILTNSEVIKLSEAGLSREVILTKIARSRVDFDISTGALVELKKRGVADEVIAAMLEKAEANKNYTTSVESSVSPADAAVVTTTTTGNTSTETVKTVVPPPQPSGKILSPKEAIASAKTIALQKSSLQPSRQALEKELLKRKDFQALGLTIERYKESADLYVEIGYVSLSWLTHRYVYRVYDRRSGAVLAAGETTSWGSLAENLARHIAKDLTRIATGD